VARDALDDALGGPSAQCRIEKYELTNHSPEDMKKAIDFLRALKRIHILFKEHNEVQSVSKRIELWAQKLEADMLTQEKQLKKQMLSSMGKEKKG